MDKQRDFEKNWEEIKEYCGDCEAWSGTDCTRNPITKDCLKERKQKQIEEMAKLVQGDMCGDVPCEECNYHGKMKILPRYCGTYLIAEKLYCAGYRKIPENAVVLTREEWKRMKSSLYYSKEECERRNQKICKETVEKFARLVEFHSVSTRDENGREMFTISALGLKEILHEEFGITYDEIAKEITEGE